MIVPVAALIGLVCPAVLGGRLARLAGLRLRHVWVVVVAFAAQTVALMTLPGPRVLLAALHVASYAVAIWFVAVNRHVPGVVVVGTGALLNGLAITLNGGTLPASASALAASGVHPDVGFVNSGFVAHPHLAVLGDVLAVPAGWPLANVFSIGDLLIVGALTYLSLRVCGTWWTPHRAGATRPDTRTVLPDTAS